MRIYIIGLILTILGWLIRLNPYISAFSIPVFLVGLSIVWFSKTQLKTKLLTIILALFFYYPIQFIFMQLVKEQMTPETFLVPIDFRGNIVLIYNEPSGQLIPKVNGRLIYKIPDNGIIICKNKYETGYVNREYSFVDSNFNIISKIPELDALLFNEDYTFEKNKNEPPRNKTGLFTLSSGHASTIKNEDYYFHMMAVNYWNNLRVQFIDGFNHDLIDSILYNCRNKNITNR